MSSDTREAILEARALGHTNIYLNYCNLRELPGELLAFAGAKKLFLKRNLLKELPSDIWRLSQLVELYLHSNSLQELPAEICHLSCLQSLDVSNNLIKVLTASIGDLQSLSSLHLANNEIKCLPKEIGNLKQLRVLDVMNNQLQWLPWELGKCACLETLAVDGNQIKVIPQELTRLQQLKEFSISRNQLLSLPQDVGMLCKLESLLLDSNANLDILPATLLRMRNLKIIGLNSCCSRRRNNVSPDLHRVIPGVARFIGTSRTPVPPLLSLCLRAAYRDGLKTEPHSLPSELVHLVTSPTGHCVECRHPYFTAVYPMLISAAIATRVDPLGAECLKGQDLSDVSFVYCCCSQRCLVRIESAACACADHQAPLVL